MLGQGNFRDPGHITGFKRPVFQLPALLFRQIKMIAHHPLQQIFPFRRDNNQFIILPCQLHIFLRPVKECRHGKGIVQLLPVPGFMAHVRTVFQTAKVLLPLQFRKRSRDIPGNFLNRASEPRISPILRQRTAADKFRRINAAVHIGYRKGCLSFLCLRLVRCRRLCLSISGCVCCRCVCCRIFAAASY